MALDPNIILQGKTFQPMNLAGMYRDAQAFKTMKRQEMEAAELKKENQTMRDILKQNVVTDEKGVSSLNTKGALSDMYKFNPEKAQAMQDEFNKRDLNTLNRDITIAKQLAWTATPENWAQVKQKGMELGLTNFDKLPDVYSPDFADRWKVSLLDGEKQLQARMQQEGFNIEREKMATQKEINLQKNKGESSKLASDLRKERSTLPTTKDTMAVAAAYNKVQSAAAKPTAAGDLSLIFNYMKMLDPGSVVREGEFATAQNAAGVPDRVRNYYNYVKEGNRLGAEQREDFVNHAGGLYKAQLDVQNKVDSQFASLAEKAGVNPNEVILNFSANSPAKNSSAKPQTVIQNGFTYTLNPQTGEYE